jgi:hypothetical protein
MFTRKSGLKLSIVGAGIIFATSAIAGPIILRNEDIPNICGLEVSVGPNAPDAPAQQFGDLQGGWEQQFDANKVCFRVSNPPDVCGSWSDWKCCEAGEGEQLCAVE